MLYSSFGIVRLSVTLTLLLSGLTIAVAAPVRMTNVSAQAIDYIPEPTPRAGEQRFNANSFKVSHNAFEQYGPHNIPLFWWGENNKGSYATQIDDYNSWGIELDLYWENGQFEVAHDGCNGDGMNRHIAQMAEAQTLYQKVTVLWLEIKDEGQNGHSGCPLPDPFIYEAYIQQTIVNNGFSWSYVYTAEEFKNIDKGKWPSWQELVRRGKNLIVVVQRPCDPDRDGTLHQAGCPLYPVNDWFFEVAEGNKPPTASPATGSYEWRNNIVFFNTGEFRQLPLQLGEQRDYWGVRMYPDSYCEGSPSVPKLAEEQGEWETHIATHATQVATNCVDRLWTNGRTLISRKVHPPQPTFVVPSNTEGEQFGTSQHPYQGSGRGSYDGNVGYQDGLAGAISRVSQYGFSTEIWIAAGDYETYSWEFIEFRGVTINRPMILKKNPDSGDGVVVIR